MHKYSYELSASYRQETYQPRQYFIPPSLPSRATPLDLPLNNNYPRSHSKTFIRSQNADIIANQQSITYRPSVESSMQRSSSGFKIKEQASKPHQYPHWKPNNPGNLQNRLKILSDLSERHQQAIKGTYYPAGNNTNQCQSSPIKGIYENSPQDHGLRRQFSFNTFHGPPTQGQRAEGIKKECYTPVEPFKSKNSMLNVASSTRMNGKERVQLRINMDRREQSGNSWKNENAANGLALKKTIEPTQTVAKLSSLQDRIRTSVQPYLHK